jgi:hypothetical protein
MRLARTYGIRVMALLLPLLVCRGQSTDGMITGHVHSVMSRRPLAGAVVSAANLSLPYRAAVRSSPTGRYALPPLPPGLYRLRAELDGHQPGEVHELELSVAGFAEIDFELRPLNRVWEPGPAAKAYVAGRYLVDFYGPDVSLFSRYVNPVRSGEKTLEATFSQVVDPVQIAELPLNGRDAYTMLVAIAGVGADAATARGLGLSAGGQRSYATHFLLDGLEANNSLVSGPLLAIAPEAVQEYRVSVANWSAEYGNASGAVANAVTRSGSDAWHGLLYANFKNDALKAGDFQDNLRGWKRPVNEYQPGFHVGGPVRRGRLFLSSAFDFLRSRGREAPVTFAVPSTEFIPLYTQPGSAARGLLERFPAPAVTDGLRPAARWTAEPPVSLNRLLSLQRADLIHGNHRLRGRLALASLSRPDFIWTPYPDFVSELEQPAISVAVTLSSSLTPLLTSELSVGWSRYRTAWDRPHPEIPTLSTKEGVLLPGSPALYEFESKNSQWEFREHLVWTRARHVVKLGGGVLLRRTGGKLTAGRDAHYSFGTIIDFAIGRPETLSVAAARQALPAFQRPAFESSWKLRQTSWFVQDAVRLTGRLTVNAGLRAENFGSPSGADDVLLGSSGAGALEQWLRQASLDVPPGRRRIYDSRWNFAPRAGFSLDLGGSRGAVLRGALGLFYDRPFDNLWQSIRNNRFVLLSFPYRGGDHDFLSPVFESLSRYAGAASASDFPNMLALDWNGRDPYSRNYFLSLQTRAAQNWSLEAAFHGANGRSLVSTDQINRPFSLSANDAAPDNPDRVFNPRLPLVSYRARLGVSDYYALTVSAAHRGRRGQFHLAYTWGHSIDNQSDPLAGDFFDLDFTRVRPAAERRVAAFSRQFDSAVDRGNSDFDQRHNLVVFSIWDLPTPRGSWSRLFGNWRVSQLVGFRSGFPFHVYAGSTVPESGGTIFNNRADLVDGAKTIPSAVVAAPGGQRILDPERFAQPGGGRLGNLGRNTLRAPGFFNIDLSLARTFRIPALSEASSFTVRADVFNLLNHANLGMPDPQLGSPAFGLALRGRRGQTAGFPALVPFQETGRQVQILLRFRF